MSGGGMHINSGLLLQTDFREQTNQFTLRMSHWYSSVIMMVMLLSTSIHVLMVKVVLLTDDPYYDTDVSVGDETLQLTLVNLQIHQLIYLRSGNAFDVSASSVCLGELHTMPSHIHLRCLLVLMDQGFTFTCQEDNEATHSYPEASDPASNNTWLTSVDASILKLTLVVLQLTHGYHHSCCYKRCKEVVELC